ncbi:zinc carboxypeptidase [Hirsutella rhossiliensis]|uniref:Zinc carboxypeptidase domain-containing protein n=1 Tax=Hirsutella rhossiliensis TaxID=111463 RepID=A0A9P8SG83_9HYPO|nr:zinc carboxypeptidase domain-containing protein [Hirsutella rhossiliensis]KAH0960185.1 zinc carboxypeptidase domain-containing protein [Hirsutella rhossiliensis]
MKFPTVLLLATISLTVDACILPDEEGSASDFHMGRRPQRRGSIQSPTTSAGSPLPTFAEFPIGKGDRFKNGSHPPVGIGAADRPLRSILNIHEIKSGLEGLARAYSGDVKYFCAPEPTFHNRQLHGLAIGDPRVFILSGIHARERGGPDYVLYFVADLLAARARGTGLRYGNLTYTSSQVRTALSAGLVVLPLANPDGVAYDQRTNTCWRKNRNPEARVAGGRGVGVDLNRNFAYLWDYRRLFNVSAGFVTPASDNPESQLFHGAAPMSEPETRNVAWVLRRYRRRLSWFLDLHSFSGWVLYGWGDGDHVQTTDPQQSFINANYDGMRGVPMPGFDDVGAANTALGKSSNNSSNNSPYSEFMEPDDLRAEQAAAERMRAAMTRAGTTPYEALPLSWAAASSGSSLDQARGPYYAHECGAARVHSLAIEFGGPSDSPVCLFYPNAAAYHDSMRQVAVGLMELLLTAAAAAEDNNEPKTRRC